MDKRLRFMTELIAPLKVAPGSEVSLSRDHDPGYTGQVTRPQATALLVLLRVMDERSARIFLDLSGVSFLDCAGLRALLTTRRRAELRGGFVHPIAVSAAVRRIADLTGMQEALGVEASTADRSA